MDGASGFVAGETLIDLFPSASGPLTSVSGFEHRPGGAPANVAVGVAALDDAPGFWTVLGDDAFAAFLSSTLDDHGVPGEFVERTEGKTALAVVTREADAERSFSFYAEGTATFDFDAAALPVSAFEEREWVHVGGVALADEASRAATLAVVERARDAGCVVSFDPNARAELWRDAATAERVLGEAVAAADVVFCSADDLALLGVDTDAARERPARTARGLLERGPETVFLTRGSEGATAATRTANEGNAGDGGRSSDGSGSVVVSEPAFAVDAVDTTGAGDAFTAAALTRYEPGAGASALREVVRYANAVAALATTATGAMGAIPTPERVERFLDDSGR
ncbi:carbohydrate kinase family protein [Halocalculus aciditolerans]|uniref:Aminoimidazole riboside kinase n=1 Tax=Halocalculus aciditolerans TaxID=1383812 RepID=A0A830F3R9_9EURY|nr:carbohydrate kinase [Halocalculus aciditolerans]GGL60373.1 aminoimidazole riboside kinase [Halocalculus aciditolerans]